MKRYLSCDCGFEAVSDDTEGLLARVRDHFRRVHGIDFSDDQIFWLSHPAPDERRQRRQS